MSEALCLKKNAAVVVGGYVRRVEGDTFGLFRLSRGFVLSWRRSGKRKSGGSDVLGAYVVGVRRELSRLGYDTTGTDIPSSPIPASYPRLVIHPHGKKKARLVYTNAAAGQAHAPSASPCRRCCRHRYP